MPINFRISALVPVGMIVESVIQLDEAILVTVGPVFRWRCVLCAGRRRGAFTAAMFGRFRTYRAQVGAYDFGSWRAGFAVTPSIAGDGFSPSGLTRRCFSYVRVGRSAWSEPKLSRAPSR
jgi:hypothetical protein